MKKKNKWIMLIIFVLVVVLVSGIFGTRFVWKMLNPEPVEAQNYYENAFVQPNTISNRCFPRGEGNYYEYIFILENHNEFISIIINSKTNEGTIKYYLDKVKIEENRIVEKDEILYMYNNDSQNPVELVSGLPYQLFEYDEFKITNTFADFADPHTQRLEGEVTPNEDKSMIQKNFFIQLKETYDLDMNVEDINGKQIFEMEYFPESNSTINHDTINFTTNIDGIKMTELCEEEVE